MYINHNPLNLSDLYVQGSSSIQYNPQLLAQSATSTLSPPYQQQLQPQLHLQAQAQKQQQNNGIYTFAAQHTTNPYDISRITNPAATQQRNSRSTSASSLSSVSSTSSNSSIYSTPQAQQTNDAQSILNNSAGTLGVTPQNQSFNNNISLSNNLYSSYNFAYYNPQLLGSYATASGNPIQQSQQNGSLSGVNGSQNSNCTTSSANAVKINSSLASYQNLNDKCKLISELYLYSGF